MKICPQCKMTYESNNLSTCANCGSQLVSWNDYNDDDKKTEETKYCPKCLNIESDPNAVFCKHCGEQLVEQNESGESYESDYETKEQAEYDDFENDNDLYIYNERPDNTSDRFDQYPQEQSPSQHSKQPYNENKNSTDTVKNNLAKNNTLIITIIVCICILAILTTIFIILFFMKDNDKNNDKLEFSYAPITATTYKKTEPPTEPDTSKPQTEPTESETQTTSTYAHTTVSTITETTVITTEETTIITTETDVKNNNTPDRSKVGRSNIINGGQACADGEYYYYGFNGIYKTDWQNNDIKMSDSSAYYMNISDDYIYFTDAENNFIHRINKDSFEDEILLSEYCYELTLYDNMLYFSRQIDGKNTICRMKCDGSDLQVLSECCAWYMNIVNDKVYYVNYDDNYKLYEMDLDGGNIKVINNDQCSDVCVIEDAIYFSSDRDTRYLYSMNPDGTNVHQINSVFTKHTNYVDGRIYYVSDDKNFYSCLPDGSDVKLEGNSNELGYEIEYPLVFSQFKILFNDETNTFVKLPLGDNT